MATVCIEIVLDLRSPLIGFCQALGKVKAIEGVALPGFYWGRPRPLRGYHAPPAGGLGAAASRKVMRFKILKGIKYENMKTFFKNFGIFLARKNNSF